MRAQKTPDGTEPPLYDFDVKGLVERVRAAAAEQENKQTKTANKKKWRQGVVDAIIGKNEPELRRLIDLGAPLDGSLITGDGETFNLIELGLRYFHKATLTTLFRALEHQKNSDNKTNPWNDAALNIALGHPDPGALNWMKEMAADLDDDTEMDFAGSIGKALLRWDHLHSELRTPLLEMAQRRLEKIEAMLANLDDDNGLGGYFYQEHRKLLHLRWTPVLADRTRDAEAASGLTKTRLETYLRYTFCCDPTENDRAMSRVTTDVMAGLVRLMEKDKALLSRFQAVLREPSSCISELMDTERMMFLENDRPNVMASIRPETAASRSRNTRTGAGEVRATLTSFVGRMVAYSGMRNDILGDSIAETQLIRDMADPRSGGDLMMTVAMRLDPAGMSGLVSRNAQAFIDLRDRNGNTFFHLLTGLRSQSRATIDLILRTDPGILTVRNKGGFSILDTLDGPVKVYAERTVLTMTVKEPRRLAGKPKPRTM